MTNSDTYDVLVVGGGGAGLAAAVVAAERGASVALVERQDKLGGTTAYSVGSLTAADTPLQRRKGIHDDPVELVEDMWAFDPALLHGDAPELRRLYAVESGRTYDWLVDHGVVFAGPYPEPPHRVPRMHNVIPNSRSYIARLSSAARRAGVQIRLRTEVTRLLTDGDAHVTGLETSGPSGMSQLLARRGVILASGDFSGNATMRKEHLPEGAHRAIPINEGALGLGHQLAAEVGAQLVQMDQLFGPQLRFPPPPKTGFLDRLPLWQWLCRLEGMVVSLLPSAALRPIVKSLLVSHMSPSNALFDAGAVLVDGSGARIGSEQAPAEELSRRPDRRGFIVLDETTAAEFEHEPNYISTAPGIAFAYFSDYVRGRPDLITRAPSVDTLAEAIGVNQHNLQDTIASSILRPPLVAMGPVFSMLTVTEGALAVDTDLRVLRGDGSPIGGLYAAGGVGQGGMLLKGHGHHIGWAMTSGRLAGQAVTRNLNRGAS
ncbi:FAD-dependent oxidoreductase [Mycolicibacterium agri]|uniref:Flavocytochrome c n=1 Tax=Mycolicibacterium agri TaxID=36811 RepID=A0A7I9VW33_MYCAG|nr:FAD-dependent oxidoreductase [Mycolicibacterium agri]GFG49379.1 flavocytochrome c [Mycolicibacterium agri]